MKYRVTEKHPFLKKDIIISGMYVRDGVSGWNHEFNDLEISTWINNNWIEEIQEPKFTEKDMINFAQYYDTNIYGIEKALRLYKRYNENKNKQ